MAKLSWIGSTASGNRFLLKAEVFIRGLSYEEKSTSIESNRKRFDRRNFALFTFQVSSALMLDVLLSLDVGKRIS